MTPRKKTPEETDAVINNIEEVAAGLYDLVISLQDSISELKETRSHETLPITSLEQVQKNG